MDKKASRDISVVTGIFLENEKGEIWFGRMPKWSDTLAVIGGHVDRGETIEQGAIREMKEEVGIEADSLEYINFVELPDSQKYFKKDKHFLAFNFRYRVSGRPEINFNDEFSEGVWMTPDDAMKRDDLSPLTQISLESFKKNLECTNCQTYKQGWARAQADYQNLQKEIGEQRGNWVKMSELQILEEFIPVYDNFKKAFAMTQGESSKEHENWAKGIEYIMKQFWKVLADHEIEEIKTVGEKFDTQLHEAVGEEESDQGEGVVLREVDGGYSMKGKVIKVAKVIVAK
jgi:molecular chaperone GrpE